MIIEEGCQHENIFGKRLGKHTQCKPSERMTEKPTLEKKEIEPEERTKMKEIMRGKIYFLIQKDPSRRMVFNQK